MSSYMGYSVITSLRRIIIYRTCVKLKPTMFTILKTLEAIPFFKIFVKFPLFNSTK